MQQSHHYASATALGSCANTYLDVFARFFGIGDLSVFLPPCWSVREPASLYMFLCELLCLKHYSGQCSSPAWQTQTWSQRTLFSCRKCNGENFFLVNPIFFVLRVQLIQSHNAMVWTKSAGCTVKTDMSSVPEETTNKTTNQPISNQLSLAWRGNEPTSAQQQPLSLWHSSWTEQIPTQSFIFSPFLCFDSQ